MKMIRILSISIVCMSLSGCAIFDNCEFYGEVQCNPLIEDCPRLVGGFRCPVRPSTIEIPPGPFSMSSAPPSDSITILGREIWDTNGDGIVHCSGYFDPVTMTAVGSCD